MTVAAVRLKFALIFEVVNINCHVEQIKHSL